MRTIYRWISPWGVGRCIPLSATFSAGIERVASIPCIDDDRGASVRVLVVEDSKPFLKFICSTLGKRPELQIIGEVSDALEKFKRRRNCNRT